MLNSYAFVPTERDVEFLLNALPVYAEKMRENAEFYRTPSYSVGRTDEQIAARFEQQAQQADELAARIQGE